MEGKGDYIKTMSLKLSEEAMNLKPSVMVTHINEVLQIIKLWLGSSSFQKAQSSENKLNGNFTNNDVPLNL